VVAVVVVMHRHQLLEEQVVLVVEVVVKPQLQEVPHPQDLPLQDLHILCHLEL
jgi:hypothetical protein